MHHCSTAALWNPVCLHLQNINSDWSRSSVPQQPRSAGVHSSIHHSAPLGPKEFWPFRKRLARPPLGHHRTACLFLPNGYTSTLSPATVSVLTYQVRERCGLSHSAPAQRVRNAPPSVTLLRLRPLWGRRSVGVLCSTALHRPPLTNAQLKHSLFQCYGTKALEELGL